MQSPEIDYIDLVFSFRYFSQDLHSSRFRKIPLLIKSCICTLCCIQVSLALSSLISFLHNHRFKSKNPLLKYCETLGSNHDTSQLQSKLLCAFKFCIATLSSFLAQRPSSSLLDLLMQKSDLQIGYLARQSKSDSDGIFLLFIRKSEGVVIDR